MEFVYTHLLSAEDMRRILKQRELRIPNIDHMSYEELQRVYSSFAVPMDKRQQRNPNVHMHGETQQLISKLKRALPPPVSDCASKLARVTLNVNVTDASMAKRKVEPTGIGIVPAPAPKRVKITWP